MISYDTNILACAGKLMKASLVCCEETENKKIKEKATKITKLDKLGRRNKHSGVSTREKKLRWEGFVN